MKRRKPAATSTGVRTQTLTSQTALRLITGCAGLQPAAGCNTFGAARTIFDALEQLHHAPDGTHKIIADFARAGFGGDIAALCATGAALAA